MTEAEAHNDIKDAFNHSDPPSHERSMEGKQIQQADIENKASKTYTNKIPFFTILYSLIIICLLICILCYLHLLLIENRKTNELLTSQTKKLLETNHKKRLPDQYQRQPSQKVSQIPKKTQLYTSEKKQQHISDASTTRQPPKKLELSEKRISSDFTQKTRHQPERQDSFNRKTYQSQTSQSQPFDPSINFQPYRLRPDLSIYSQNGQKIIKITKPLLVSMNMQRINHSFEIKFEAWVIRSYSGRMYSSIVDNKKVQILQRVNTRTAPLLESKYTIGVLDQNHQFSLIRKKSHSNQVWYQIIVRGYVKANDLN